MGPPAGLSWLLCWRLLVGRVYQTRCPRAKERPALTDVHKLDVEAVGGLRGNAWGSAEGERGSSTSTRPPTLPQPELSLPPVQTASFQGRTPAATAWFPHYVLQPPSSRKMPGSSAAPSLCPRAPAPSAAIPQRHSLV
jgi:hypothetical protein